MATKFYVTVVRVTVLSRGQIGSPSLGELHVMTTEGDCSGDVEVVQVRAVTKREMRKLLAAQGTDEDFIEVM